MASLYLNRIISILAAANSLALTANAHAQGATELPGIVIEAAGLEGIEAGKLGSAYTVITGKDIEERQIRHAAEALRDVTGVSVSQSGGPGSLTQVRIRGAEANQTAVFIDGVQVNSLDAGDFDFSTLLAADISRIEVLRGPQSGVYGANALAGVVNIITKKGPQTPMVTAQAEAGSFNTHQFSANASGGTEQGYVSVSAARRETDGFNVARNGSEEDGSMQQTIFARAGLSPTKNFRIDAMARIQVNETDIDEDIDFNGILDDAKGELNKREQRLGRISAELDLFDKRWSHKVFADYLGDKFTSISAFFGGALTNDGERVHYGYQTAMRFDTPAFLQAKHTIIGLIEQKDESFVTDSSSFGGDAAARHQTGYVAEYQGEFAKQLFITGNIRRDDNDSFEDALTYRATAAYLFKETGTRPHASYGKGITNPNFFEQFGLFFGFVPNPGLKPEESIGWDAGVEQKFWKDKFAVDVTYFKADLKDEIITLFAPIFTVINAKGASERQGVETQISLKPMDGLTLTGSYTYTESEQPDTTNPKKDLQEIRRPRHAAGFNAAYAFAQGKGSINLGVVYNGVMKDVRPFVGERLTLDDYLLVRLSGSYKLSDQVTLFGRVENLLNENYEEVFSFTAAPIAAYGGVKVTFGGDTAALEPAKQ